MSWRVQYHPEAGGPGGVVEVVFGGMLSGAELLAGAAETLRVAVPPASPGPPGDP